jgi:hypothetical protein
MVKEVLLAVLAFVVAAIVIIILMTAAGNLLFPSAVSIVETRLETAPETETAGGDRQWSASGPRTLPHPEAPAGPGPETGPAEEPPSSGDVPTEEPPPPDDLPTEEPPPPGDLPAEEPPPSDDLPAEAEAPTTVEAPRTGADDMAPESPVPPPRATVGQITDDHDLSRGEILPLGDGRVAYKVESGDTFSQICKKVIGTGRQQVWQRAAEMMDIDIQALRPGMVLIFDEPVLALGQEE